MKRPGAAILHTVNTRTISPFPALHPHLKTGAIAATDGVATLDLPDEAVFTLVGSLKK